MLEFCVIRYRTNSGGNIYDDGRIDDGRYSARKRYLFEPIGVFTDSRRASEQTRLELKAHVVQFRHGHA